MDIISLTLGLPLLPLRGVLALANVLKEEAEREMLDPSRVRRRLEDIEDAEAAGEIPADEAAEAKQDLLDNLIDQRG